MIDKTWGRLAIPGRTKRAQGRNRKPRTFKLDDGREVTSQQLAKEVPGLTAGGAYNRLLKSSNPAWLFRPYIDGKARGKATAARHRAAPNLESGFSTIANHKPGESHD